MFTFVSSLLRLFCFILVCDSLLVSVSAYILQSWEERALRGYFCSCSFSQKRVFLDRHFSTLSSEQVLFPVFAPEWGAQFRFIFYFCSSSPRPFLVLLVCDSSSVSVSAYIFAKLGGEGFARSFLLL